MTQRTKTRIESEIEPVRILGRGLRVKPEDLTKRLARRTVSHVSHPDDESISVHFTDGSTLRVKRHGKGVAATVTDAPTSDARPGHKRPTARQREYLEFIKKYILRFGVSPAESDIERHFLVSAPSVNQMMRSLERAGHITRRRDLTGRCVPRSIRVVGGEVP
jgi:repressor LexA